MAGDGIHRSKVLLISVWLVLAALFVLTVTLHGQTTARVGGKTFATPQEAAKALIDAADRFDEEALKEIFGAQGEKVVLTGETGNDRERAKEFANQAHEKDEVEVDPKNPRKARLSVGDEDWPFPVPIVEHNGRWSFDARAGEREILYRRVGRNELDAIEVCRGYVQAQDEYAEQQRNEYDVSQYAQRIVSTPGKHDGLAWQNSDGSWDGPIGENVAMALDKGYSLRQPYHGYFFKILKGQGPAAPLGEMDFVLKGIMIGGFALAAAPAQYRVTGVKSFIVGYDGVVYQKDLGPETLQKFQAMTRYNPDKTWSPVPEQ